jgi:hypothetical protein
VIELAKDFTDARGVGFLAQIYRGTGRSLFGRRFNRLLAVLHPVLEKGASSSLTTKQLIRGP